MIKRSLEKIVLSALNISPAVLVKGARQTGKSTLLRPLLPGYVVFDDIAVRMAAKEDPKNFIFNLKKPVCIDEVQKAPEILEYLKLYIDSYRKNGEFIITGSANILDMKRTKDTLAGRIIELELYPLSAKEKHGRPDENIIDNMFDGRLDVEKIDPGIITEDIIGGFYPEASFIKDPFERNLWFGSYISTYVERDARNLGEIRDIDNFFRFINILAPRSATQLNKAELSRTAGVRIETLENYLGILRQIFQINLIRPYQNNIGKQFVKSPKIFINDTGIVSYLLGISNPVDFSKSRYKGPITETFVLNELLKHIACSAIKTELYHYRTSDKKEIDFILRRGGKIIAVEVKASSYVGKDDFNHIADFMDRMGKEGADVSGVVFYTGEDVLHFGDKFTALPLGFLY